MEKVGVFLEGSDSQRGAPKGPFPAVLMGTKKPQKEGMCICVCAPLHCLCGDRAPIFLGEK